jgi:hypothetical protein
MQRIAESLTIKIQSLSPEQFAEVEGFVESLQNHKQHRSITHAASAVSETAFANVWNNPEDDVYDAL